MTTLEDKAFQQRLQRIEPLLAEIDAWPDGEARSGAIECIQTILELHAAGLRRILDHVSASGDAGSATLGGLAGDELVSSLLLLHGLHPLDLETRVRQALDRVRPSLQLHQGNVELLSVHEGAVRLRLQGTCHGCASSALTLKMAIESAIAELAPDVESLEVEGVVESAPALPPGFIPLTQITTRHRGDIDTTVCPAAVGGAS